MTGNGVSASLLGKPDVGLVDLTLFTQHAHRAAACDCHQNPQIVPVHVFHL